MHVLKQHWQFYVQLLEELPIHQVNLELYRHILQLIFLPAL